MSDTVRFLVGIRPRALAGIDPTLTVLEYLRGIERRCGTKEGCAEGDCGACTVVIGEPAGQRRMRYRAVNACIRFAATLHGKQLLSVEDLASLGELHPVQRAMVETHASQCGFCTPGFVMSLFAFRMGAAAPTRAAIEEALAGNLCRCTGYRPIIAAAAAACADPTPERFLQRQAETAAELRALAGTEGLHLERDGRRFIAPPSIDGLANVLAEYPNATILAGGTDVGLWVTKDLRRLETVAYIGDVAELAEIAIDQDTITIGAGATYTEALAAIAADYPDFGELIRRLGSVQIRNAGTIGGNIANGSPIGDTMPALLALDATLLLRRGERIRQMKLAEFYTGYRRSRLEPGEFVLSLRLPRARPSRLFGAYKISKRFDQDISAVCAAFAVELEGRVVRLARLGFGGMAATPARASRAEAALEGREWSEAGIAPALAALDAEFSPISDMRASAAYRRLIARNLLRKFVIETAGAAHETTRVWREEAA